MYDQLTTVALSSEMNIGNVKIQNWQIYWRKDYCPTLFDSWISH